jgi:hypothetical protein
VKPLLALTLGLLSAPQEPKPEPKQDSKPAASAPSLAFPARAPIAGLAGFHGVSTVTYAEAPERPHELEATYVFPDRARWQVVDRSASASRHIVYRAGAEFFVLEPGTASSQWIDASSHADDRAANLRAFELRRALFLWPDGFAWKGQGSERSADFAGGSLVATLGADGRPETIAVETSGAPGERYESIRWSERRGRWWPRSLEFVLDGARVWSETVESVDTQVHLLDLYFVPPDRRPAPQSQAAMLRQVIHGDVPGGWCKRVALAAKTTWSDTEARWRKEVAAAASAGQRIEPGAWVELDRAGRPVALVLHLSRGSGDPPHGTEEVEERTAVVVGLNGVDLDLADALRSLEASAPEGTAAGEAYARFAQAPGPDRPVRVYLTVRAKGG